MTDDSHGSGTSLESSADSDRAQPARPPLGLPIGSVRALLTLVIVSVVVVQVLRGHAVQVLWTETLLIALAHYFTSRRFINLPATLLKRLEEEGHLEKESHPLYLPRHSIRAIIVLAFVGLAVYLYRQGRLFDPVTLPVLGVVLAYLVGIVTRGVVTWWTKGRKTRSVQWWEDLKACVVLGMLLITAAAFWIDKPDLLPPAVRSTTLAMVLFYFGSR